MIDLATLHPRFIGLTRPDSGEGITFDCPTCGPSHQLIAYFSNPVDGKPPAPWLLLAGQTVWKREGETLETLTLEPSLKYPCWHGWLEDGKAISISDATHVIAQIVVDVQQRRSVGELPSIGLSPRQVKAMGIR